MSLYEKALTIAVRAHKEQLRRHKEIPYVVHPIMVARLLEQNGFSEEVVAAGLVHDVLEDTDFSEDKLREELGGVVVDIVKGVSEDTFLEWEERKERYVAQVVAGGEPVWAVSVADKIHNAQSLISYYDEAGAVVWQNFNRGKEKKIWFERLVLESLKKVWRHPLLTIYEDLVQKMEGLEE